MEGIDNKRWTLSLVLRAVAAFVPTLGLAIVLGGHTSRAGVDLAGAVPYLLPVFAVAVLGAHYSARWEDAALDHEPGGAVAGHTAWRRALAHVVGSLADVFGVALVVGLPWIPWQARTLTLMVVTATALVLVVLSYARREWGRCGRDVVLFVAASYALASLPVEPSQGAPLRETFASVALMAMVVMVGALAVHWAVAIYRWRRGRTVRARRARLMNRAHIGAR